MHPKTLPNGRLFKIHCSQISKILGRIGMTETQAKDYVKLRDKPTALTDIQKETLAGYLEQMAIPTHLSLPQTAKTFLNEWYADDKDELFSKEVNKGNIVELDNINFMTEALALGAAERNLIKMEDDYFVGTCDVDAPQLDAIIDVKSPWNCTTFHSKSSGMERPYALQGVGYCHLWKRKKFILFYALMDTPAECNYDQEISFAHLPDGERWIAYETEARPDIVEKIIERVELCRDYLLWYDEQIRSKVGKITKVEIE